MQLCVTLWLIAISSSTQINKLPPIENQETDQSFNLRDFLFSYVLRYWYLYALGIAGAGAYAWLKIRYTTPIYQQKATILIRDDKSKGVGGASEEAIFRDLGLMQGGPTLLNEIQILKSRPIMTEVVKTLGLDVEYYQEGRVRTSELYPAGVVKAATYELTDEGFDVPFTFDVLNEQSFKLTRKGKTTEHQFGQLIQIPEGTFTFTLTGTPSPDNRYSCVFRRPEDAAADYVGSLGINQMDKSASVLELSFQHPMPGKGIDVLTTLVEVYNQNTIDDQNRVGRNTIKFVDERIKFLSSELSDVEGNLENYKKSNEIPSEVSSSVDMLIQQFNEYDQKIGELEIQKSMLDALSSYLKDKLTRDEPAPVNLLPPQENVAALVARYNELLLERNRLMANATAQNPVVINLSAQVDQLRLSILETIANTVGELRLNLSKVRERSDLYLDKLGAIPGKERGLLEIKRQQVIKENLFLYLLQKREETALSLAVAVANARVVDPAINTGGPISPNQRSVYLTALLIGLLIPSALVYLRYAFTTTVQSEADITKHTRTPILGSIGYQSGKGHVVVHKNSRTAISEMFRLLRTNLQFLAAGEKNQVIIVTSGTSGEGKSFVTLNLGITLALSDKKTVVLELDLRKPKLIRYLTQAPAEKGITNYLIGQMSAQQLVQPSQINGNLSYIASGPIPPNPAELLLTRGLDDLIAELREHYDYIILDTPPVGMVADALLLSRLADSALYVVRQGLSHKSSVELIDELHRENKLPRLAVVFNGVQANNTYGYGKKYGYGYGYGYGYYEEDRVRKPFWKFWRK